MRLEDKKEKFRLKLKGKTAVFVDWANIYCWKDSLKWGIALEVFEKYPPLGARGTIKSFIS